MNPFEKRVLGRTGLSVPQLSFGGTGVGSLFGHVDERAGEAVVETAYTLGIRYFDCAPLYGHGSAERRFGTVLRNYPREEFVLSTKTGRRLERDDTKSGKPVQFSDDEPYRAVYDFSRDGILRSLESSFQRLGIDSVDIVYIHDPQDHIQLTLDEAFPALAELRSQGVIKSVGIGANFPRCCQTLIENADFDCLLLANRYTLLEQEPLKELLPLCKRRGVGIVIGGVFNSGILAKGPVPGACYDYRPAPEAILEKVRRIEKVCGAFDVPLPAAAVQFPLGDPIVASVLVSTRSAERLSATVDLMRHPIPDALWQTLKEEGLLASDALVPTQPLHRT